MTIGIDGSDYTVKNASMTPEEIKEVDGVIQDTPRPVYDMNFDEMGIVFKKLIGDQLQVVWALDKDGFHLGPAYGEKL